MSTTVTSGPSGPTITASHACARRAQELLIPGCQSHKRSELMLQRGFPVFAREAQGAHFVDVDGNRYVDYLMGFGPIVLGHGDPGLAERLAEQYRHGSIYSTAWEGELRIAERLTGLVPGLDRVGFFVGGSGATTGAIRLARAATGRELVLRCGYHGWHDWCKADSAGVPAAVAERTIAFPYNDLDTLGRLLQQHGDRTAAVIIETVQEAGPEDGYLASVIALARHHGALAICDEVKTGCRIAVGGACERYGLRPDIAVFGKAFANGLPGSFLLADSERLNAAANEAWLGATFHADTLSLAAIDYTLDRLAELDGIELQDHLGRRLINGINTVCARGGLSYRLIGPGAMPQPVCDAEDKPRCVAALRGALRRGHYLHPGHVLFVSCSHTDELIDASVQALAESIAELDA